MFLLFISTFNHGLSRQTFGFPHCNFCHLLFVTDAFVVTFWFLTIGCSDVPLFNYYLDEGNSHVITECICFSLEEEASTENRVPTDGCSIFFLSGEGGSFGRGV